MSGFITIYNTDGEPVDRSLLYSLTQTLKFRGPDQQKVWVDGNIGMGHALFKTTFEAEYENQPATIDNKVWITCSARIDDRENLVNKMGMKKSLDLSKTPDSELILHAYRKWGEECLEHLLGDFAFVIWDKEKQKLFCAKDQFGINQLYYVRNNHSFIFSNDLKTLLKHPDVSKKLSYKAIAGFLLHGEHAWMDKSITVFEDIRSILPAHKLIVKDGNLNSKQYWSLPISNPILQYKKKDQYIEHFLEIFRTSVKDRIRTDSVVISMSGGMDSTSIAAITKEIRDENRIDNLKITAVTGTYESLIPCQEGHFAGMVARHLDIPIHFVAGDDYPLFNFSGRSFTQYPVHVDTPDYAYDVAKKIASLGRVVLTGTSADNLLASPRTFLDFKENSPIKIFKHMLEFYSLYHKLPPLGIRTKAKELLSLSKKKSNQIYPSWLNTDFEASLSLTQYWDEWISTEPVKLNQRHQNVYDALTKPSWNSEGIYLDPRFNLAEARDPYMDLRMVNFIFSIPTIPWFFNKHLLRSSMENYLPEAIIKRPKTFLNNLLPAELNKSQNKWIFTWKPSALVDEFVERRKFSMNDSHLYQLNTRVIILERWINELHNVR